MSAADYSHLNRFDETVGRPAGGLDPLRLCVNATVALIAVLAGPLAVAAFAGVAIGGYTRARRAGMLRSRCILGDTRVVLGYLWGLAVLGLAATPLWVMLWIKVFGG
jgi:hypothetical protein